jgi:hypothetical protein
MNFNDFLGKINESRAQIISEEEFYEKTKKILKGIEYDSYVTKKTIKFNQIWRGLSTIQEDYVFYNNLSSTNRLQRPKNPNSYIYNIWIDTHPSWEKYPKRKHSLIMSNDSEYASNYSYEGDPHLVIMDLKAKCGICPTDDIWYSFSDAKDMHEWFPKNYFKNFIPNDWRDIISKFDEIFKKYGFKSLDKKHNIKNNNPQFYELFMTIYDPKDSFNTLEEILSQYLDPQTNGFKLATFGDIITKRVKLPYSCEIWASEPAYLCSINVL